MEMSPLFSGFERAPGFCSGLASDWQGYLPVIAMGLVLVQDLGTTVIARQYARTGTHRHASNTSAW